MRVFELTWVPLCAVNRQLWMLDGRHKPFAFAPDIGGQDVKERSQLWVFQVSGRRNSIVV